MRISCHKLPHLPKQRIATHVSVSGMTWKNFYLVHHSSRFNFKTCIDLSATHFDVVVLNI